MVEAAPIARADIPIVISDVPPGKLIGQVLRGNTSEPSSVESESRQKEGGCDSKKGLSMLSKQSERGSET